MHRLIALLFLIVVATGCTGLPAATPRGYARTVQVHGGLCPHPACQERAEAVLVRLVGPDHGLTVEVVESASPRAFAWPSGHLLVSCGLAQDADEGALAAALAHECGHLLDDGHLVAHPATLAHGAADAEARADEIGAELLARAGYDPEAMDRLVACLATDPYLTRAQQRTMRERLAILGAAD